LSDNDLYYAALDGARVARLTQTPDDDERWAEFSPDGRFVAFIRSHDLYVVDVATQSERRLTEGGDETLSNGETNWVYMEEVFGRGNKKAFWWSPDSMRLAFLQFDDAPVYEFTLIDHIPDVQRVERSRYPKPGEPNPWARLGVVRTGGGEIGWADLSERPREDTLVTRVGWTPDSSRVWFYIQDRAQKFLDFMTVSPNGGAPRKLFRDENGRWVAIPGLPTWLDDGSFLLFSERTGWKHIYHYSGDGRLRGQVTDGPWEVTGIEHVDKANGVVFFSGTRDSHIARNLYRVNLDGSDLRRLTFGPGTHNASISPDGATFIDTWSDVHSPAKIALFDANAGRLIRTIDDNPAHEREEWDLGRYELVQIPTADGFVLEGSLLYPPDFDPSAKHPVWFQTYGGPHSPRIRNAFNARERDELLANWGLIVFYADPRSASGKGAVSTWTAYKNFGVIERDDIATAIEWLKEKPFIDGERIGMQGHSYGGFMTSYMMTHGDLFKAGIAGAPVTDWRLYDTIYTERYMDTPQRNPEGYDATSVILAAENLHGRLLIGHGLIDDNVHFQNTVRLVDALQRANKQNFEVMFYPRSRHGIGGDHYRDLQLNFIRREMLGLGPVGAMN
jgi:dipeptidyl-peptidase-4